jgi:type IV pilus biogenesis protein PilP
MIGAGMSSYPNKRAGFRLLIGYPVMSLTEPDNRIPIASVDLESPDAAAGMTALAARVKSERASLRATLPETEVWRGELRLEAGTPFARRKEAATRAARRLGILPGKVRVVLGKRQPDGRTPVAAVPHRTLAETEAFLSRSGLRVASIEGDGEFAGFPAPPSLMSGLRRTSLATATHGAARLARRGARSPGALATAGVCVALALFLLRQPVDVPEAGLSNTGVIFPVTTSAAPQSSDIEPEVSAEIQRSDPPRPRPAGLIVSAPPADAASAIKPPPALTAQNVSPPVTVASRNAPADEALKASPKQMSMQLEQTSTARVRLYEEDSKETWRYHLVPANAARALAGFTSRLIPFSQPSPEPVNATDATNARGAAVRPRPRSEDMAGTGLAEAIARSVDSSVVGPSVRVASLDPAMATTAVANLMLSQRPEPRTIAPRRAAVPKPVVAPVRKSVRKPVVATRKQVAAKPARQAVASKPAPVKKPAVRTTTRAASKQVGLSSRKISLIGVFGNSKGRHALLRLPNGSIARVKAGDSVQGVQVAAVDKDSVRLHGSRRDTLLKMD